LKIRHFWPDFAGLFFFFFFVPALHGPTPTALWLHLTNQPWESRRLSNLLEARPFDELSPVPPQRFYLVGVVSERREMLRIGPQMVLHRGRHLFLARHASRKRPFLTAHPRFVFRVSTIKASDIGDYQ
jgi:hypothetical protein